MQITPAESSSQIAQTDQATAGFDPSGTASASASKALGQTLVLASPTCADLGKLSTLPPEILINVFSRLKTPSLVNLNLVNRLAERYAKQNLRHFKISTKEDLKTVLQKYPKIESLTLLAEGEFTDDDIKQIPNTLKYLNVSKCEKLTDNAFSHWDAPPQYLDVSFCSELTNAAFAHWPVPPEHLNLCWCDKLTDAAFTHWKNPPKHLNINSCHGLGNSAFAHWATPPEYLDASFCVGLNDASFSHWETAPQRLNVNRCMQLTDAAFTHWEKPPEELNVTGCTQLTNAAFAHWSSPNLVGFKSTV